MIILGPSLSAEPTIWPIFFWCCFPKIRTHFWGFQANPIKIPGVKGYLDWRIIAMLYDVCYKKARSYSRSCYGGTGSTALGIADLLRYSDLRAVQWSIEDVFDVGDKD